jgi:hypothetical protein
MRRSTNKRAARLKFLMLLDGPSAARGRKLGQPADHQ